MTNFGLADSPGLFRWKDPRGAMPEPGALCVLGAPTDHGNVVLRGAAHGPTAIRRASARLDSPRTIGWDIGDVDRTDTPDPQHYMERLEDTTRLVVRHGLVPLLIGGDHSVTYAPVSALSADRAICIVWLDAHTDFSPWSEPSHHNHKQVLRRISTLAGIRAIVQIGYRGITIGDERRLGARSQVVTSARARQSNAEDLVAIIPDDLPCYLSIDIDVIDPAHAPGTSAPVPGGLAPDAVAAFLRLLVRHREIVGIDLTEVNPAQDDGTTAAVAARLIAALADQWDAQKVIRNARAARTQDHCDRPATAVPASTIPIA